MSFLKSRSSLVWLLLLTNGCLGAADRFAPLSQELESLERLDFGNHGGFQAEDIAHDAATGMMHVFLSGQGILVLDTEYAAVDAIPLQTTAMFDRFFLGMTIADDKYVVASDQQVHRFDLETTEQIDSHVLETATNNDFGWTEMTAVARHDENTLMLTVSKYNGDAFGSSSSELHKLDLETGSFESVGSLRIDSDNGELAVQGLARYPGEDIYLVATDNLLGAITEDGTLLGGGEMPEVTSAGGLTIDADAGLIWVTDRFDLEAHAYDLTIFQP